MTTLRVNELIKEITDSVQQSIDKLSSEPIVFEPDDDAIELIYKMRHHCDMRIADQYLSVLMGDNACNTVFDAISDVMHAASYVHGATPSFPCVSDNDDIGAARIIKSAFRQMFGTSASFHDKMCHVAVSVKLGRSAAPIGWRFPDVIEGNTGINITVNISIEDWVMLLDSYVARKWGIDVDDDISIVEAAVRSLLVEHRFLVDRLIEIYLDVITIKFQDAFCSNDPSRDWVNICSLEDCHRSGNFMFANLNFRFRSYTQSLLHIDSAEANGRVPSTSVVSQEEV